MKILYVEDDLDLAKSLSEKLTKKYNIETTSTVEGALEKFFSNEYALIITDFFLPDKTGIDLCRFVREEKNTPPILFLTVNESKRSIVQALNAGADDYLSKPFDFQELEARIRTLLKRSTISTDESLGKDRCITLSLSKMEVMCAGSILELPRQEYILLEFFLLNTGRLVSRQEIYEQVWGNDEFYVSNTIDVHIRRLRERLREVSHRNHIKAVYGMGYRFSNELIKK